MLQEEATGVTMQPRGTETRTMPSSGSNRPNRTRRSQAERLRDQLEAQSQDIAELRALLLQQHGRPAPGPERSTHYSPGPDDLLESVEDAEAPHFARLFCWESPKYGR